jgi:predicted transcriptional regulator
VVKAINNISVSAAIADGTLAKGQTVGLGMKNGLLYASEEVGSGACGIAYSDAEPGRMWVVGIFRE